MGARRAFKQSNSRPAYCNAPPIRQGAPTSHHRSNSRSLLHKQSGQASSFERGHDSLGRYPQYGSLRRYPVVVRNHRPTNDEPGRYYSHSAVSQSAKARCHKQYREDFGRDPFQARQECHVQPRESRGRSRTPVRLLTQSRPVVVQDCLENPLQPLRSRSRSRHPYSSERKPRCETHHPTRQSGRSQGRDYVIREPANHGLNPTEYWPKYTSSSNPSYLSGISRSSSDGGSKRSSTARHVVITTQRTRNSTSGICH